MALVLPSTVEELNSLQNSFSRPAPASGYIKASNQGFENIVTEKKYKREYSLPNGVENWNISNFDPYLNFEDNALGSTLDIIESRNDRLVPEEGDQRPRCESFSSVSSSMDDKQLVYHNMGVKTFSTVCMDSGSTCISSDHSYVHPAPTIFKGLDAEETYQNLDVFLQQVPDFTTNDTMSSTLSSISSPGNDSNFDIPTIQSSFSMQETCHQDSMSEKGIAMKRPLDNSTEDDIFALNPAKRPCDSGNDNRYHEIRRKNNIASKNCRKTRKEKQKEMEIRVAELEKEKEGLKVQVQVLEDLIQAHKTQLYAILQKR